MSKQRLNGHLSGKACMTSWQWEGVTLKDGPLQLCVSEIQLPNFERETIAQISRQKSEECPLKKKLLDKHNISLNTSMERPQCAKHRRAPMLQKMHFGDRKCILKSQNRTAARQVVGLINSKKNIITRSLGKKDKNTKWFTSN